MKHYNRIKNLLLAGLTGFIYYKYIVPSIPILDKLFALAFVIAMVLAMLESWDKRERAKTRAKKIECNVDLENRNKALRN